MDGEMIYRGNVCVRLLSFMFFSGTLLSVYESTNAAVVHQVRVGLNMCDAVKGCPV